jgi:hypothetical protein
MPPTPSRRRSSRCLGIEIVRELEIPFTSQADPNRIERSIDEAIADAGLAVTLRTSLKKFPGCVHWHVRRGREPGTLEITYWPKEHRAWFTIQDGRRAASIDGQAPLLADAIRRRLRLA